MKIVTAIVLCTLSLATTACVPYHYTQRPAGTGTVLDASTGAPISGAKISLYADNDPAPVKDKRIADFPYQPAITTTSDAQGKFAWPAHRKWGFYFLGQDFAITWWRLDAQHPAYQRSQLQFGSEWTTSDNPSPFKIELKPIAPTSTTAP